MLFRSFASFFILAAGLFALSIIFVLMVSVGAFGDGARQALAELLAPIQKFYGDNNNDVDWAIRWLGGLISALTGTFAIYKSWYYAEFSLPRRLSQLIKRRNALLWDARPLLLAGVNDSIGDRQRVAPLIYFYPVHRLLRDLGFGRPRYLGSELVDAIDDNERELAVVRSRMHEIENEIVTGHILKGSMLAAEATLHPHSSLERSSKNRQALGEFKAALGRANDDVDALMFAARQSEILGDDGSALDYLGQMAAAAAQREMPMRQAVAFRLQAEISSKRNWNEARVSATAARDVLDGMVETSPEKTCELLRALLLLGQIQTKREKFTAARQALGRARMLLPQVGDMLREEFSSALGRAEAGLRSAQQDKEEPGD